MIPVLVGNVLQLVYLLVDTIMVGRLLGTNALASVGAATVIAHLFINLCNSFTSGFSIIIGQYFGAQEEKGLKKALASSYWISALISVILTFLALFLITPLLKVTNVPQELISDSTLYLKVIVYGLAASVLYNLMANILRSYGETAAPLFFLILSALLNIVLDYVFIAKLNLGIAGAALATDIAQGFSGAACVVFCIFKRKFLAVSKKDFIPNKLIIKQLITQGLSMCLMLSIVNIGSIVLQIGINSLGTELIAGYTAGRKYVEFLFTPGGVFSLTAATFVSQNYGARKFDRIKECIWKLYLISFVWTIISIFIGYVFGKQLVMSVTGKDASLTIINAGIEYIRVSVLFYGALFVLLTTRSALQGMNHKKTPVISSTIEMLVKIFSVIYLVPFFGYFGICITEPIIWVVCAVWCVIVYIKVIRKESAL